MHKLALIANITGKKATKVIYHHGKTPHLCAGTIAMHNAFKHYKNTEA